MFGGGLRESLDQDVDFRDSVHPEVSPLGPEPCSAPPTALTSGVPQVLELLLDFAYSSRVVINEENAESLLEAADMLQFPDVRDAAAAFLEGHLNAANCLGMMLLADAHQCKRLYELSWRMCLLHYETVRLRSRNPAGFSRNPDSDSTSVRQLRDAEDFCYLPKDKLLELILSDELEIEDEQVSASAAALADAGL